METNSPEETVALGRRVAREVGPGDVLALWGELGSGKTVFTKGLAAGLGLAEPREVTSPTYVLLVVYDGAVPLNHFDAYRLSSPEEFLGLDGGESLCGGAVSVVEWADRVAAVLPDRRVDIRFEVLGGTRRRVEITPRGGRDGFESIGGAP